MFSEIGKPSPMPSPLVVKNGSKMRSMLSGAMPGAVVPHQDLHHPVAPVGGPDLERPAAARRALNF
jgi:hypothetical protein